MEHAQDVHLEEVFWRSPQHVQMMGGFLHSNNSKLNPATGAIHLADDK